MSTSVISFKNITKRFPGVTALDQVSFDILPGSWHGLVGENGAGKSTLGKLLAGICTPDGGAIHVDGRPVRFSEPHDALDVGIAMVHQELAFCENLSVAENLCLGMMPAKGPFLLKQRMLDQARQRLDIINASLDVSRPLGELTVGQQQMVQIAAAVARGAKILIFDEPTSSLSHGETQRLFEFVGHLKRRGLTAIYISHRLQEIFDVCDQVTVLRDGRLVATTPVGKTSENALIRMMIGRPFEAYFPSHFESAPGEELLRVENLSRPGKFHGVSFTLRAGEILGLAGLVGAGRTELAEALFGLNRNVQGQVAVCGDPVSIKHPAQALKRGIGLIPEDRKRHGLVLSMRAYENITLPILGQVARWGWISNSAEQQLTKTYIDRLQISGATRNTHAENLSGGNQQKLVLARWLAANCKILLFDEPTRGVDVGAKAEIHNLIDQVARAGSGILLISSELPELLNLATRILVMRAGQIVGELSREQADQESTVRLMAGAGLR